MDIRESTANDQEPIRQLLVDAFGEEEGEAVSTLAIELLNDATAQPMLSLVAEANGRLLGHVLFTPVAIKGQDIAGIYILCPLGVARDRHGTGVGTALIKEGLRQLSQRNARIVLVYGDPNYYNRTGFAVGHDIAAPYPLEFPDAWMAQELEKGALATTRGTARCAAALSSPEHW